MKSHRRREPAQPSYTPSIPYLWLGPQKTPPRPADVAEAGPDAARRRQRLRDQLRRQLGFIERSCRLFDEGAHEEGIRIATALRILFYESRSVERQQRRAGTRSISLLTHLDAWGISLRTYAEGLRREIMMPKAKPLGRWGITFGYAVGDSVNSANVGVRVSRGSGVEISAGIWWTGQALFVVDDHWLTREAIVIVAANKDGGAHVDETESEGYRQLTEPHGSIGGTEAQFRIEDAHLKALREMGREILNSEQLLQLAARA